MPNKYVKPIEFSTAPQSVAEENFRALEKRAFYLTPQSALAGPPTTGGWELDELYVDAYRSIWLCTAAGLPGTWQQWTPGLTASTPVLVVPTGYEILRDDQERRRFRWDGAGWVLVNRKYFNQTSPALTWGPFTHGFGYIPQATVLIGGKQAGVNVELTATTATVCLNNPQAGTLILD